MAENLAGMKPAANGNKTLVDKVKRTSGRTQLLLGLFLLMLAIDAGIALYFWGPAEIRATLGIDNQPARLAQAGVSANPTATLTATRLEGVSGTIPAQTDTGKSASLVLAMIQPSRTAFMPETSTPTATLTPLPSATETPSPSATPQPEPSLTPLPPLPDSAMVSGLYGVNQALPLSCESRSAADWANFFGYKVSEMEFQNKLPRSDNPARGFVGDPRGNEGMIPPNSYGVYAEPVAALLREYGVPARAYSGLGFDDIRREIAAGRPVIVWVVGAVQTGKPVEYTASDGETLTVVSMEHTVMVAGYTADAVYIQDGSYRYVVSIKRFRASWRVLGNMAILVP